MLLLLTGSLTALCASVLGIYLAANGQWPTGAGVAAGGVITFAVCKALDDIVCHLSTIARNTSIH
ncbi:hypothetical protein [Sagittula sp. MA-2]|jgi:hypothetical protein|uniref:hypothetical protein n=1 Tax=Sagittula sp. MA-2 TaxID=3048007 RepID=UPI0024C283FA|nr:hypothetical protein [Sagittula sp. MA-2]WHZ33421.1 hypothetical protein QNI11_12230 [Sagittula sp. MA-2]